MADVLRFGEELARLVPGQQEFAEVFRSPSGSLSLTVVRWPAGSVDDQQPHTEDEVYYVVAGRGTLVIDGAPNPVAAGSVAYVAAGVEHRFTEITEDLEVLVFWSPARHTDAQRTARGLRPRGPAPHRWWSAGDGVRPPTRG
jgi:mannose-6-phosphate isomerase-like protein (cupin superfamily)